MLGFCTVTEVTSRRRDKIRGISRTPTFKAEACRKVPLLKAGSSAMEMFSADAPPLRMEACSLPMWTARLSAAGGCGDRGGGEGRRVSVPTQDEKRQH